MSQEEFFKRYTYSPSRDRIGLGGGILADSCQIRNP